MVEIRTCIDVYKDIVCLHLCYYASSMYMNTYTMNLDLSAQNSQPGSGTGSFGGVRLHALLAGRGAWELEQDLDMRVSKNQGPQYEPQIVGILLIIRTSKKWTPDFRNSHVLPVQMGPREQWGARWWGPGP